MTMWINESTHLLFWPTRYVQKKHSADGMGYNVRLFLVVPADSGCLEKCTEYV